MLFKPSQFVATKFSTAEDKAWFANQFVEFIESGFDRKHFTDRFYRRLSMTFGHIAHFNRLGFWERFFETEEGKQEFLAFTLLYSCYGDPTWTYSDVERALQVWLKKSAMMRQN